MKYTAVLYSDWLKHSMTLLSETSLVTQVMGPYFTANHRRVFHPIH